jgi:hypothetical protein
MSCDRNWGHNHFHKKKTSCQALDRISIGSTKCSHDFTPQNSKCNVLPRFHNINRFSELGISVKIACGSMKPWEWPSSAWQCPSFPRTGQHSIGNGNNGPHLRAGFVRFTHTRACRLMHGVGAQPRRQRLCSHNVCQRHRWSRRRIKRAPPPAGVKVEPRPRAHRTVHRSKAKRERPDGASFFLILRFFVVFIEIILYFS